MRQPITIEPFNPFIPILLFQTTEIKPPETEAALQALKDILNIVGVQLPIEKCSTVLIGPEVLYPEIVLRNLNRQEQSHYSLILTRYPMKPNLFGCALRGVGAIISLREFEKFKLYLELLKQLVYHEFGHVFCSPNEHRACRCSHRHCTNRGCAMRQGYYVNDWIKFAEERRRTGIVYCSECINDLRRYFNNRN